MTETQVLARPGLRRWLRWVGCVLILCTVAFWRPLQQRCLVYFLLHSEGPAQEVLAEAVQRAGSPASLLMSLWRSERIPHREFVLAYLGRIALSKPDLFRVMEPVVLEGTGDADLQVRELAFAALVRMKNPELRSLALEQLTDPDPAVRLLGLQSLRSIATSNDVPIAVRLLRDPEPRVVVAAALVLRQATGQDFGIKSTHALPQFTFYETNPPPAPDVQAISKGVQRWQAWWNLHQSEYSAVPPTRLQPRNTVALATPDFSLADSSGKPIHLSDFRGKDVLLAFWSLDAPANLDMLVLKSLKQRNPGRLAVLGICIPADPSCANEHEHHHHHGSCAPPSDPQQMRDLVQAMVRPLQINYPMLIDAKSNVGLRFNVEDRPTYVLIDAQGKVRRRFAGLRTERTLAAIFEETAGSGPEAERLSVGIKRSSTVENRNTETPIIHTASK